MPAPKLSAQEISLIDDMQKDGEEPKDILAKLQRNRTRNGSHGPGHAAVYNFLAGKTNIVETPRRTEAESPKMPPRLVSVAGRIRKRLIQQANDQ